MVGIKEMLFGSSGGNSQLPTMNQGQMGGLDQLINLMRQLGGSGGGYGQATDYFQNLLSGGPEAFQNFEAPYRQQFEQVVLPGIAERFAGMNPMGGGLSSSGFGQALGSAGAQLQAQLAGLHGNLQQGAASNLTNQYNQLSNQVLGARPFENQYQQGSGGLLGNLAGGFGSAVGIGGGGALMQALSRLFGGI